MTTRDEKMRQKCSFVMDEDFIDNVKLAQLLFEDPFLGVVVTTDDQVYAIGADSKDYFELGPVTVVPKMTKVESLCGQKIVEFTAGAAHILAMSEGGVVYAWGCNSSGQLGDDTTTNSKTPIVVAGDLTDKVVRQIDCCENLSVVLTDDGEVFTWGGNGSGKTGHGTTSGCTKLPRVVERLADHVIISVGCNLSTVLCLNDQGKILAFGYNGNYGLGNGGCQSESSSPVPVKIPDHHWIHQISCGRNHSLAVTNNGLVFVWGTGASGQLGTNTTGSPSIPVQINFSIDETFDQSVMCVRAVRDTSYAVDITSVVYVWGSVNGSTVTRPVSSELEFPDTNINLRSHCSNSVTNDLLKFFDDKASSDLAISVGGKDVHVHKSTLQMRSEYFRTMFSGNWKETEKGRMAIELYSYVVYRAFLRYLYCGKLSELEPEEILRLMDLAKCALDDRLMTLCIERLKKSLRFDNVAGIFSLARTLEQEEFADYCVRFALKGMRNVIASGAFSNISGQHAKDFLRCCVKHGSFLVD